MSDPVYLDYNAATPVAPEVVDAMLPFLREHEAVAVGLRPDTALVSAPQAAAGPQAH